MKSLFRKLLLGVLAVAVLGALGIGLWKWYRVANRPTMEKSGGTVLVYELDVDKFPAGQLPADYQPEEMIAALKRRLDPSEDLGIVVRHPEANRVEVSIPGARVTAEQSNRGVTAEAVQRVKDLVNQIGLLEFRILANEQDDQEAIAAARAYFAAINDPNEPEGKRQERQSVEDRRAGLGLPPRGPSMADGKTEFRWSTPAASGEATYSWVELSRAARLTMNLDNGAEADPQRNQRWLEVAQARAMRQVVTLPDFNRTVLCSREYRNLQLLTQERQDKRYEYFQLTRDPKPAERVTSQHLRRVNAVVDQMQHPAVDFGLTPAGGELFHALTSQNKPSADREQLFSRHLAIILDGTIMTAPQLRDAIRAEGRITGNFTNDEVERLVLILRAGALPAALKPLPVSESVVEPMKQ
jgi:SecD/SecF fusion protein